MRSLTGGLRVPRSVQPHPHRLRDFRSPDYGTGPAGYVTCECRMGTAGSVEHSAFYGCGYRRPTCEPRSDMNGQAGRPELSYHG